LEIELDGLFKTLLLLRKKKYAAVVRKAPGVYVRETKVLAVWC